MADIFTDNNIFILSSYIAAFIVIAGMAGTSFLARRKDQDDLRKLEKRIRELSGEQGGKQV